MKIEVTIERLRRGRWVQHARGKWEVAAGASPPAEMDTWIRSKGVPTAPTPGWAIRMAFT